MRSLWKSIFSKQVLVRKPVERKPKPMHRLNRRLGLEHLEDRIVPVLQVASPSIITVAGPTVLLGTATNLTDTATLSQGNSPTGTITFTLTSPNNTVVDTETVQVQGDGIYTTPNGYLPTQVGTYNWSATYSGDWENESATDNGQNESEVVTTTTPSLETGAYPSAVTVGSGSTTLNDIAALQSGNSPTGTITFNLTYNGQVVYTDQVPVTGNTNGSTGSNFYITTAGNNPGGYTLPTTGTVVGNYQWSAAYSGDVNNSSAHDQGGSAEAVVVSAATPAIATTPSVTSVALGTSPVTLKDTAALTAGANPTGTITFTLYDGTAKVDTETATVSGDGTWTTPTGYVLPSSAATGNYQWDATYSGDGNNSSVSENNSPTEQVVVTDATPAISTTPNVTSVTLCSSSEVLNDTAALTGAYSPTGTITFTLYLGRTKLDAETVAVNGNGNYTTPTGYTLTGSAAAGTYQWDASYSGDSDNSSVSENNSTCEQVKVSAPIQTATWLQTGASPGAVTLSTSPATLEDIAALTGGNNPTGSITFTLTYAGQVVYTDVVPVNGATVNGKNFYFTTMGNHPGGYTLPTTGAVIGNYQWSAKYSGDLYNAQAQDQGGSAEAVVVSPASPTLTTQASITSGGVCGTASTADAATVSGGDNPTGSITFTLTAPDGTTSTVGTVSVSGDATYSAPTSVAVSETGTYTWHASYSGDNHNAVAGDNGRNESVTAVAPPNGTITGTKYLDVTGNGFSCDDTPLGGVTVVLFKDMNNNGVLDIGDGSPVASTVTGANGTYSFTGLAAGTYFVEEVVASGYVQTGGGPSQAPGGSAYYTVNLQSGQTSSGNNFDDYKIPTCTPTNISYTVCNGNSSQQVTKLTGSTQEGESVTVTFTVTPGMTDQLSLVSYIAPAPYWTVANADLQQIYDVSTGTFSAGTHCLTVELPNCYYQIDFVCGTAISQLNPPTAGPDYINIDYNTQDRLLGHDNGGTQPFSTQNCSNAGFVSANFWTSCWSWQNPLSYSSSNLGEWLATSFPNLYGAGTGSHCLINSNGTYFSNGQVLSCLGNFSGNDLQVLSAALSVYFTSTTLSGSNASWYNNFLHTSSAGCGMDICNVGSSGSAFGVANNTCMTVMQLLEAANSNTKCGSSVSSGIGSAFSCIN